MDREDQIRVVLGFQEVKQEVVEAVTSFLEKIWRARCSAEENRRQMEEL